MSYIADFSIIRTPFLPFENAFDLNFTKMLNDSHFREAIYLSSPSLMDEVEKYLTNSLDPKEKEKLELSIYRYYLRMCYRCTPFGLFAGISLGAFSDQTKIHLTSLSQYKKNTRLDTHFLSSVVQEIVKKNSVIDSIKWYSNNTVYPVGEKLRYIEYRLDKFSRSHHLTHVDFSDYVQAILDGAQRGATIKELASILLLDDEISLEEATSFIKEMISSCLLVSELEPLVTGSEFHDQLVEKLKLIPQAEFYLAKLQSVIERLNKGDKKGVGVSVDYYNQILSDIKTWQKDFDSGKLFQCDLFKPIEKCQINVNVMDELNKAIALLDRITPQPEETNLKKFKEEFEKRYESQEISLLKILDADTGIGYPVNEQTNADYTPLLELQLKVGTTSQPNNYAITKWTKFLFRKFQEAIRNKSEIEITDDEIKIIFVDQGENQSVLPDSVYTMGSILASSGEEVDKGNFLIYHDVTAGPSAVNLLGRFCYMNDELKRLARETLLKEEQARPNCVYAEILHIAQARLGNILMRPTLRDYEIPILTSASVDDDHVIKLNDLMVSIRNGRIVLRSKRLNKEVIPRLTTAHNFSMNPVPHYHFLCDLQFQGIKGGLSWNWGVLNEFSFLPRVRYRKTILSKARWLLALNDFSLETDVKESTLIENIKCFFQQNRVPALVTISQGDNQLPINTQNVMCLKILAQDLKKYKTIILLECLFEENNVLVRGPEGSFTNEIIIPWGKQLSSRINNTSLMHSEVSNSIQKSFQPGSEWHFVKIYCGVKTADRILTEIILPLSDELLSEGLINKWFYIRYADPDHHLRIRFSGTGIFYAEVTRRLSKALEVFVKNNLIWKIQTDTYNRELERYGSNNIENSETLFFYDSIATVNIIALLEGDEGDELRWQFALKGVNDLLNSFGLDLSAKKELMFTISNNFLKEFNADNGDNKKQLSSKYRDTKSKIYMALGELDESHEFYSAWRIFGLRSKNITMCVDYINKLKSEDKLTVNKTDLIASYTHMFLNRFLRSKQRLQEMVIYDLLHQHYRSLLARNSKTVLVSSH